MSIKIENNLETLETREINIYLMIKNALTGFDNAVKPNYRIDGVRQGYVSMRFQAWGGRFVSLMDIPSQLAKTVILPVVYVAAAVASVATGLFCVLGGIVLGITGLVLLTSIHGKACRKLAVASFKQSPLLFAGLFVLPVKGLWSGTKHAMKTAGDVVGVILPEVGRMARRETINPDSSQNTSSLLEDSDQEDPVDY